MPDSTHILIVKAGFGLGGIERSLVEFLRHLDYGKYHVDLLLLFGPFDLTTEIPRQVNFLNVEHGGLVYRFSFKYILFYLLSIITKLLPNKSLYLNFKQKKIDIYNQSIYRHCCRDDYEVALAYHQGLPCEFVAKFVKASRKIMMYHHGSIRDVDYLTPWFKQADILLTVSDDVAKKMGKAYPFAVDRIKVIPNLIDEDYIRAKAVEYVPSFPSNVINLCTCGRISPEKGFDYAIDVAAQLKKRNLVFHWFFVGDGYNQEYTDFIKHKIIHEDLCAEITITGFLTNPYPYIKACDIIVIPSRFEANPMIVQEAKILAKPIVATRTTGAKNALVNSRTGIICDISVDGIAKALMDLAQSPNTRCELVSNLQKEDFSSYRTAFYKKWDAVLLGNH